MIIRKLRESEVAKFVCVQKRIFAETQNFMISNSDFVCVDSTETEWTSRVLSELESQEVLHLVSEIDGEIRGFLTFRVGRFERCRHRGEFTMGILKEYWGRGVGRELLSALELWAVEHGVLRIELSVLENNSRALRLYVSAGFQVEGRKRVAMRIGTSFVDGFWMAKILDETQNSGMKLGRQSSTVEQKGIEAKTFLFSSKCLSFFVPFWG